MYRSFLCVIKSGPFPMSVAPFLWAFENTFLLTKTREKFVKYIPIFEKNSLQMVWNTCKYWWKSNRRIICRPNLTWKYASPSAKINLMGYIFRTMHNFLYIILSLTNIYNHQGKQYGTSWITKKIHYTAFSYKFINKFSTWYLINKYISKNFS